MKCGPTKSKQTSVGQETVSETTEEMAQQSAFAVPAEDGSSVRHNHIWQFYLAPGSNALLASEALPRLAFYVLLK